MADPRRNHRRRHRGPRIANKPRFVMEVVITVCVLAVVCMTAKLITQQVQINNLQTQTNQMLGQIENGKHVLSQYTSRDSVIKRAEKLGMIMATGDSVRRIQVTLSQAQDENAPQTASK